MIILLFPIVIPLILFSFVAAIPLLAFACIAVMFYELIRIFFKGLVRLCTITPTMQKITMTIGILLSVIIAVWILYVWIIH